MLAKDGGTTHRRPRECDGAKTLGGETPAMEDRTIDKPTANSWATNKILLVAHKLGKDEQGAALVEYTVLLGVMLVTVISTVVMVGGWVNAKWSALWAVLQSNQ
jgi:pilus assembly protein Flp/PilA